jgi:hypothetical protein
MNLEMFRTLWQACGAYSCAMSVTSPLQGPPTCRRARPTAAPPAAGLTRSLRVGAFAGRATSIAMPVSFGLEDVDRGI